MNDSRYDLAQICQNGHVINSMAREFPDSNQDHCDRCGVATIVACPSCNSDIRGYYHVFGVIALHQYTAPAYCHKCGRPFPWTASGLLAAEQLAAELEGLSEEERTLLKESLKDLVCDTPGTRVAETRFKRFMKKAGKDGYEGMRSILTDIVSEGVRKSIFGS